MLLNFEIECRMNKLWSILIGNWVVWLLCKICNVLAPSDAKNIESCYLNEWNMMIMQNLPWMIDWCSLTFWSGSGAHLALCCLLLTSNSFGAHFASCCLLQTSDSLVSTDNCVETWKKTRHRQKRDSLDTILDFFKKKKNLRRVKTYVSSK